MPVERVVLRAFGKEANYLRDLPLHPSQRELESGEGYTDFELSLRPTGDFIGPLLSKGAAIKVLEPKHLADDVKAQLLAAIELYK